MTNGIARPDDHLAIPMGPQRLFVAVNAKSTIDRLCSWPPDELVQTVNDNIVKQARRFVIGPNDSALSFVAARFGTRLPSSPTENIKW